MNRERERGVLSFPGGSGTGYSASFQGYKDLGKGAGGFQRCSFSEAGFELAGTGLCNWTSGMPSIESTCSPFFFNSFLCT